MITQFGLDQGRQFLRGLTGDRRRRWRTRRRRQTGRARDVQRLQPGEARQFGLDSVVIVRAAVHTAAVHCGDDGDGGGGGRALLLRRYFNFRQVYPHFQARLSSPEYTSATQHLRRLIVTFVQHEFFSERVELFTFTIKIIGLIRFDLIEFIL